MDRLCAIHYKIDVLVERCIRERSHMTWGWVNHDDVMVHHATAQRAKNSYMISFCEDEKPKENPAKTLKMCLSAQLR